jgi:hypothetical protein
LNQKSINQLSNVVEQRLVDGIVEESKRAMRGQWMNGCGGSAKPSSVAKDGWRMDLSDGA